MVFGPCAGSGPEELAVVLGIGHVAVDRFPASHQCVFGELPQFIAVGTTRPSAKAVPFPLEPDCHPVVRESPKVPDAAVLDFAVRFLIRPTRQGGAEDRVSNWLAAHHGHHADSAGAGTRPADGSAGFTSVRGRVFGAAAAGAAMPRCAVTPKTWQSNYRIVSEVMNPGGSVVTGASFVVENSKATVNLV